MFAITFGEDWTVFGVGFEIDAEYLEFEVHFAFWYVSFRWIDKESI